MKVLYDYQGLIQRIGGVSRYHVELFRNFSDDIEAIMPKILSDNVYLSQFGISHRCIDLPMDNKRKQDLYKAINIMQSRMYLSANSFDLFHPTGFNPYYVGKSRRPVVLTVHDLNFFKFPDMLPKAEIVQNKMRRCINYANHIIAISEETKEDVVRILDISEDKISVVYHGIDQNLIRSEGKALIDIPYILYIGGRNGYKNFTGFLKAFASVDKGINLVCTGMPFNSEEQELIAHLKLENRIRQMFVSDVELNNLLCYAIAFVYPSLGEGFGLPILEAYRCGCPCIISNLKCFREVAEDAALYFNPSDIDDMANTINKAVKDNQQLVVLRERGYQRMKMFTWKKTAHETEKVYHKILEK